MTPPPLSAFCNPLFPLQDIREALPDLAIVTVAVERNDGRYKPSAKIALENPEVLDEWPKSRNTVFVGSKDVNVCVGSSDGWLCVAKLPLDYTDHQFAMLAGAYGKVKECFLMVSEKTGKAHKSLAAAARGKVLRRRCTIAHCIDLARLSSGTAIANREMGFARGTRHGKTAHQGGYSIAE